MAAVTYMICNILICTGVEAKYLVDKLEILFSKKVTKYANDFAPKTRCIIQLVYVHCKYIKYK